LVFGSIGQSGSVGQLVLLVSWFCWSMVLLVYGSIGQLVLLVSIHIERRQYLYASAEFRITLSFRSGTSCNWQSNR
jgi:hypothetical protein